MRLVAVEEAGEAEEEGRVSEDSAEVRVREKLFGEGFEELDGLPWRGWSEVEVLGII